MSRIANPPKGCKAMSIDAWLGNESKFFGVLIKWSARIPCTDSEFFLNSIPWSHSRGGDCGYSKKWYSGAMELENKTCQNCKKGFTIESEDFNFYERIKVPPPTFCPECRMIRRFLWRNERALYKRTCDVPKHTEEIISMYSPDVPNTVFDQKYWWTDGWDPLQYGREYDFSVSFLSQFKKLRERTPLLALANVNSTNSEWCNPGIDNKNCYLSFAATKNENANYCNRIANCRDSLDLYLGNKAELSYSSLFVENCTKVHFSMHVRNCIDSWFLFDCSNCSDCIGCVNLRNKQFHIFNEPHTKEGYQKEKEKLAFGSFTGLKKFQEKFKGFLSTLPRRHANMINTTKSTGDNLENVKNARFCFDILNGMENAKYCVWGGYGWKDSYDSLGCNGELMYEVSDAGAVGRTCSNTYFSIAVTNSIDVRYSHSIKGCSHIFGCVALRDKQYCILNKQYTKGEFEELVPKIIKHMNEMPYFDKKGRVYKYGEYFPSELTYFPYKATASYEWFPLSEQEAQEKGFLWYETTRQNHKITLRNKDIPDNIKNIDQNILSQVIECAHKESCEHECTGAFRIIKMELDFLKRMNIPLPRLCTNCRHYERLALRNPPRFYNRECVCNKKNHTHGEEKCEIIFQTSYAPERPEIVYCEKCYQQEVY